MIRRYKTAIIRDEPLNEDVNNVENIILLGHVTQNGRFWYC